MRARVTQIFRNPTQGLGRGGLRLSAAAGGAVDTLKMVVGDRVIVGDIKERQQARIIYEQAKRDGQKAALTEQERPNIFTNSVANIGPGETVLVQIEYQEPVHQTGQRFLAARADGGGAALQSGADRAERRLQARRRRLGREQSDPVPDRDRISPPVLDPATHAPINPTASPCGCRPASRSARSRATIMRQDREARTTARGSSSSPKASCRRIAISN